MNQSISDTFDNISFTASGQLVNKNSLTTHTQDVDLQQEKVMDRSNTSLNNIQVPDCFKISFDDSAFFNGSFSNCQKEEKDQENKPLQSHVIEMQDVHEKTRNNCDHAISQKSALSIQTSLKEKSVLTEVGNISVIGKSTQTSTKVAVHNALNLNVTCKALQKSSLVNCNSPHTQKKAKLDECSVNSEKQFVFSQSDGNKLSMLGLPSEILQKYECRGITRIFPWQLECLSCEGVLTEHRNLVYSAPTSAGKTLVAEILAIKAVLERNKKVIFVLPFVSVVREKMFYFQDILGSSGVRVEGFMGNYNPPGGFKNVQVAICTIEKANSLINRLLEEAKLSEIGAVVVDELHLIGDPGRGYLLELMLTKLTYIAQRDAEVDVQIIGMSATLPNLDMLGKWLNAALYVTFFRPIPLNEQCLISGEVFDSQLVLTRRLEAIPELETDTDNVLQLCLETLLQSCSVLIFCPTKNWCESLAVQIATAFFKLGSGSSSLGVNVRRHLAVEPIKECLEQLKRSPAGLDDVLQRTVSFGVAFHHAGVTMDERDIIEGAFRSGALKVLVATSTLSSGVNLPARRVIIRTPIFFGKPIDALSYKQMVGRAGRMGKDTAGESILICPKKDSRVAKQLMTGELEAISSCLEESDRLTRALLEIIASEVAATPEEIETFGRCTLLHHEGTSIRNPIENALEFLIKYQFVRLQAESNRYVATPLAKACLNSSMPPEEGLVLLAELEKARQCFVLETDLHLIYLVTPPNAQIARVDWLHFLEMWEKLPASMRRVGELVGVKISFIINCSSGRPPSNAQSFAIHRRFYTALALQELVDEVPLSDVAERFNCNRGALQGLQQTAAASAGRVTTFSRQLGWSSVELLVGQFQDRLQFGVARELLDLMRLPILNGQRARVLFNAGVESLIDLAACNVLDLENILHKAKPFESRERDGESKREAEQRNNLRTIFITGRRGLTELEAAKLMIEDARVYLQHEIGLTDAKWSQTDAEKDTISNPQEQEVISNDSVNGVIPNKQNDDLDDTKESTTISESQDEGNTLKVHNPLKRTLQNKQNGELLETRKNIINQDPIATTPHIPKKSQSNQSINGTKQKRQEIEGELLDTEENAIANSFYGHISGNKSLISNECINESNPNEQDDEQLVTEDNYFNLTSLRLSSSSSLTSISSPHILNQFKKVSSSDSLFNDSFDAEIMLIENSDQNQNKEEKLRYSLEDPSLLTKAFMDSFNQSLTMQTSIILSSPQKGCDVSPTVRSSIISEDDLFLSPSQSLKNHSICENLESLNAQTSWEIINITQDKQLFNAFLDELKRHDIISLALGCDKYEEEKKVIGIRMSEIPKERFTYKTVKLHGIAIHWPRETSTNTTFYIELEKLVQLGNNNEEDISPVEDSLEKEIRKKTIRIFNAKECLKLLHYCLGWKIEELKIEDPRIGDWLLDPESPEQSFERMIKMYSPSHEAFLQATNSTCAKMSACLEGLINWDLVENVKKRLSVEDPHFLACFEGEMQIVLILTKMELSGMPVDVKALQAFADSLKAHLQALESEAFNIAGRRFSFTSSAAVAKILQMRSVRGKHAISTNKAALVQWQHPLTGIIVQWRKINATLTKMIYPLLRHVEDGRIHGTCVLHNATGRISMHEPNVQNVPRDFHFIDPRTQQAHAICIRAAFGVVEDRMRLVGADYCQLELRILAHLSDDTTLCAIMRSECDIFRAIAAQWRRIGEDQVDDTLRQQTKQICYGIVYGIGAGTLAEQMNVTEDEALDFIETFHQKYPGIRRFTKRTIARCAEQGYVETLLGRRRYLPLMHSSNPTEKSKAERQAVNTTVQGSAADIAKRAMILVDAKVTEKFRPSRNPPKLVLQLHDELLYEVPVKYEDIFARMLRKCMQESVRLNVPLPVKVQSGKSWGGLIPRK